MKDSDALQLDIFSLLGDGHSYVAENLINTEKVLHKTGHKREKGIDAIKTRIRLLSRAEQQYLRNWLDYLLEEKEDVDPPARSDREVIRQQRVGAIVYQLEKVRCGKGACKSCPHGPYWYGYQRFEGKFKSFYIGKKTPAGV